MLVLGSCDYTRVMALTHVLLFELPCQRHPQHRRRAPTQMVGAHLSPVEALQRELAQQREIPPDVQELIEQRSAGTPLQQILRQALRKDLDVQVRPVVAHPDGHQAVLDKSDMITIYKRRRSHMQEYRNMLKWAIIRAKKVSLTLAACPLETPRVAFAFWHSTADAPRRLPHASAEGLASCVRNSGLAVFLLAYQLDLGDVPAGVTLLDASNVLPWTEFARLLLTTRVQHLSDYVRALALARGIECDPRCRGGGWLIDGDTIWLRSVPTLSVACPPRLGHWFASQHACKSLRGHDKAGIDKHWRRHYLREPGDFLHIALPMACPAMSPVLQRWLAAMEEVLYVVPKNDYTMFMRALQNAVRDHGMERAVAPPGAASPVQRAHAKYAGDSKRRHLFDAEVVRRAMCINNLWQSTQDCAQGAPVHELCDQPADADSLWQLVSDTWKSVAPSPCRRLRSKVPFAPAPQTACDTVALSPAPRGQDQPMLDDRVDRHRHDADTQTSTLERVDACVGESVWGEPFLCYGIFDLP